MKSVEIFYLLAQLNQLSGAYECAVGREEKRREGKKEGKEREGRRRKTKGRGEGGRGGLEVATKYECLCLQG